MSITRLYLITHAHTEQDADTDTRVWRLSHQGKRQAAALAELSCWREVALVALSSEPKTRLTFVPTQHRYALPSIVDARFDELRRGGWVGDYGDRVRRAFATPQQRAVDWEAAASAQARFLDGVDDLVNTHAQQTIALISHGLVLSLYRAYLLGRPTVHYDEWRELSFAAVALVDPVNRRLISDFQAAADSTPRA